jgi:hypothetical protein
MWKATVYSHCARQTIQKLLVSRDDPNLANLVWTWEVYKDDSDNPEPGWAEKDDWLYVPLVNPPIFNKPVWESGDGPGYYSAEINIKGKIIYGSTWSVRDLNDPEGGTAAGDYRVTFSLDPTCGDENKKKNTDFKEGVTGIFLPSETEIAATIAALEAEGGEVVMGGAEAKIDHGNDLTYMDLKILEKNGQNGGKK